MQSAKFAWSSEYCFAARHIKSCTGISQQTAVYEKVLTRLPGITSMETNAHIM